MPSVFFEQLMNSSFTTFVVPFILIFAIVFGILSKINLFKKEGEEEKAKRINLGISLIIGLIFASVSLATNCLSAIMPKFAIVLTVLLVFYMILNFKADLEENKALFKVVLGILAIAGFLVILFMSSGACGLKIGPLNWIVGDWWKWVVGIIIVFGMGFWIFKEDEKNNSGKSKKTSEKAKD